MEFSGKLWDLGNVITGFAVAQNLVFTYAVSKKDEVTLLVGVMAHICAFILTLLFNALYIAGIMWCGSTGRALANEHPEIWRTVTCVRVLAVLLFAALVGLALLGHWRSV